MRTSILHVIDTLAAGGAERVLITVLLGLREKGFRQGVHLLYSEGPLRRLIPDDCAVFGGSGMESIVNSIRGFRPDAIQSWVDDAAIVTVPLAAARGIPLLHRIPNIPSAQYAAHSRGDLHVRRFKVALQNTTRVFALSDAAADDAAKYFDIKRPAVIYNGFPLVSEPSSPAPPKQPGTILIVTIGRLAIEKGHRHLVSAMSAVRQQHPSARCWIVGEGPLEADLRRQITELGLDQVVTLQGYHEDVAGMLRQADLFVMPSLQEGFGNALVEAMVAGLPIIVSDLPAVRRDILRDEPGCYLVPAGNVAALGDAINSLITDENARRAYAEHARAISERFQASRMVDEFADIYNRLLAWRTSA